ncbi:alpha-glucosidase [Paenibacillus sp. TRM 82003]|nr:alpha-glucosidase [Paenibacillus sp. TRM 82003]
MKRAWWKESVVYQIYPRSFRDSNGDGVGDLEGIRSKLDYLVELGIDVIWICPIYRSPNDDNGYDISDYEQIMDDFGTMDDFDRLLAEAHEKGVKLILDLVINHTSDEHPWFIESRASKDSPKRDYYVWRDGKPDGGPPTNWESFFSGSTWEYDEATQQYYLHLFSRRQPDLNWENPEVVDKLHAMVRRWLDKGIDGFRVDAINHIAKAEGFPDADNPEGRGTIPAYHLFSNLPRVHDHLQKLNRDVFRHYDIMTVGETSGVGPEGALLYMGEDRGEFNMVFHFEHMGIDFGFGGTGKWEPREWSLNELKEIMTKWQTEVHGRGWNANYMNNHDQPRAVSRFGNDGPLRGPSAKMLATFVFTLEGTPYVYQGEEIGMTNVALPSIDDYRDVEIKNFYRAAKAEGWTEDRVMEAIWRRGRDNARTPMQWDGSANAGFTTGEPWIAVNGNYKEINAEEAQRDPNSIFHYYRKLIELRRRYEVFVYGRYELLLPDHQEVFAYTRTLGEERLLVLLNFFGGAPVCELPEELAARGKRLLIANYDLPAEKEQGVARVTLRPYEARVYLLT